MTRSKKGRRKCHSCAPGCKCEWCMSGVKRRAVRQAPLPHTPDEVPTPFEAQVEEETEAGMKEADRDVYLEWLFPDNQEW